MKKQKAFNDFETLATYNFVDENKDIRSGNKTKNLKTNFNVNSKQNIKESEKLENVISSTFSVLSPNSLEEINKVIISLKNLQPIIIDLTYKKETLTQKVLNYLNGAVFALGGSINKLTNNIYLILPKGTNINLNN